ncbi:hypothetical protein LZ31DRAFT_557976 [Colletotrichum somersetense]|nr:hypothetical protein LZ31DRAFT_557976 [Colletotrichum somersetense]
MSRAAAVVAARALSLFLLACQPLDSFSDDAGRLSACLPACQPAFTYERLFVCLSFGRCPASSPGSVRGGACFEVSERVLEARSAFLDVLEASP